MAAEVPDRPPAWRVRPVRHGVRAVERCSVTNDAGGEIARIRAIFREPVESVEAHSGDDFKVLEVNREWMFRFPRTESARAVLGYETRFLAAFRKLSPLTVPGYEYVGDDLVGYRKIEGLLFTPRRFSKLGRETQSRIAQQMGEFLSALHAFPVERARALGLTEEWGGWTARAAKRFREEVAPALSTGAREGALTLLDQFSALEWEPVVIHGDFYPQDHVFYDEAGRQLSGVIDFGDVTLGDAAADFQSLWGDFGAELLKQVLDYYSPDVGEAFVERVKKRVATRPLFHAAYALEAGPDERFRTCLAEIESAFGQHGPD